MSNLSINNPVNTVRVFWGHLLSVAGSKRSYRISSEIEDFSIPREQYIVDMADNQSLQVTIFIVSIECADIGAQLSESVATKPF